MKSRMSVASRPATGGRACVLACLLLAGLSACGQKGPLTLPAATSPAPQATSAAVPAPAASARPAR